MMKSSKDYQEKHKREMKKRFERVRDYNALPGEWNCLYNIYTKMLITTKERERGEREQELQLTGKLHHQMMEQLQADEGSSIEYTQLFDQRNGTRPKTVVLHGVTGIGKSYTVQKFILDWANGKLYQDLFNFVIFLDCKEISRYKDNVSIEDLIFIRQDVLQKYREEILQIPEKVLIIVEGFDRLIFSSNLTNMDESINEFDEFPVELIMKNLIGRQLYPGTSMLITTRPEGLDRLKTFVTIDFCAEILGFMEEQRRQYIHRYFKKEEWAKEAVNYIQKNEIVFTMCHLPVMCWIVSTVMRQEMENEGRIEKGVKSTTQAFLYYTRVLSKHHNTGSWTPNDSLFQRLGALALDGLKEQRIMFDEKHLQEYSLDCSKTSPSFLTQVILREDRRTYSFAHLKVQEYFAAVFFYSSKQLGDTDSLLAEFRTPKPHTIPIMRFFFGLMGTDATQRLNCTPSPEKREKLLRWMKSSLIKYKGPLFLELLHILDAMFEEDFPKSAMEELKDVTLSFQSLQETDSRVLRKHLQYSFQLQTLELPGCHLGDEGIKSLVPVLSSSISNLTQLDLSMSNLGDLGIHWIVNTLTTQKCKLQNLGLINTQLTSKCCLDLQSILDLNTDLRWLNLGWNALADTGVKDLCSALQTKECPLLLLGLEANGLTHNCAKDLSSLLSAHSSLNTLVLSCNDLGDEGVKILCTALQKPQCKLEILWLQDNALTDACASDLCQALSTNQCLKMLVLTENNLGDSGLIQLCDSLKSPDCKLQALWLRSNNLTDACAKALCSALHTNKYLIQLNLSENAFTDESLNSFIDIIGTNGNLKVLGLNGNKFTSHGREKLKSFGTQMKSSNTDVLVFV
ncbi:NACHT, LRR and PYD domains-containing protein 3-like [Latimeria chalumnae]|uniref:NACHT, LRR and PYD domains-containing protein 3-like n=1 Tax=Latimeria chalumnae TaxID=7897 RepID=UPI0003C17AF1|nr:PREDICTED: NACHT, LRR and PYD domains-containing protein 3-like isoform X1 [Latimeria chalumnae]|eukprot:XP_006009352.1 PREDICTED: NACHT, LRR and PYD domains-containing protein 3-like isoform X1 [Latimeria chalumnae]